MLTNNEIRRQMELGNIIIEDTKENPLKKPNSCDLRIGNVLYVFDYSIVDTKNGPIYLQEVLNDMPNYLRRVQIPETGLLLEPHKVYLAKTVERVKTDGFVPVMYGKANFSLLGLSTELSSGNKSDHYSGPLLLSIIATKPTIIYPDIDIANLAFFPSLNVENGLRRIKEKTLCGLYQSGMLSGEEIKRRMNQENPDIVIDKKDLIVINPNSVNLTLNDTIGTYSEPVLDIKKDNPVEYTQIDEKGMWFYPDEVYLGRTNEWTETYNFIPMMSGRSSLGRNGLHVHCSAGMGSIGYKGYWHLGMRATRPIKVFKDMKCCQIYYFTPDGEITNNYNGFMQNLPEKQLGSQMHKILVKENKK